MPMKKAITKIGEFKIIPITHCGINDKSLNEQYHSIRQIAHAVCRSRIRAFFYGNAINKILFLTVFISIITIDFNMLIR